MRTIAIALSAALCLTSCSALAPTVISDPQIVRVPGATRYVAVDQALTDPTPAPAAPVPLCVDAEQLPTLCDAQLALWIVALQGALERANADKAAIALLGEKQ